MKKVRQDIINNYYFIELCCSQCVFKNHHHKHKIVEISDEESLIKEKVTIDLSSKEFNEIVENTIFLKDKIENEIDKINKLYEKIIDKLAKSYLKKHEQLKKEENEKKEKLQNEVTKIKEELEKFLSESNKNIKLSEKINQGIKKLENEDKNMIKTLSYTSKLNKNQKEMKNLLQKLMKSLKFDYQENKNDIIYEEYYFSGLPIPNNIEFKDVAFDALKLYWKIDNININEIDINKFKFKVEMKENGNKNFIKVYEGNDKYCSVSNLKENTNYEFKICTLYNSLTSLWTSIQEVKTNKMNIDSIILKESNRENEFLKSICEWTKFKKIELLFRGSRDGMTSKSFHNKCDNQGETITLCINEKGNIFGGYASIPWKNEGGWTNAIGSFVFTLTNIYNIEVTKFPSKNNKEQIFFGDDFGPDFSEFGLYSDLNSSFSNFPVYYEDILGKGKSIFTGDSTNDDKKFRIKEVEVYKIVK